MKVVDGIAVFPLWLIAVNPIEDDEINKLLTHEGFIDNQKNVYDESEKNLTISFLDDKDIPHTIEICVPDASGADSFKFNNKDELVKYLNEGKEPRKSIEQLEAEVKSLEDALLTVMFSGV